MDVTNTEPSEMTKLREEYDQYCRILGERSYVLWVTTQEVANLQAKMAELNKKASEMGMIKEQDNAK